MAQRFGRNQRRRARQLLASEQAAHASAVREVDRQMQYVADLQRQLHEVAELLGTNFLGLGAKLSAVELPENAECFQALCDDGSSIHKMHILGVDSSESWHRSAIHLRTRLASGEVVYSLSETSLHRAPAEYLAERIAREMAPVLVRELRRKGIR